MKLSILFGFLIKDYKLLKSSKRSVFFVLFFPIIFMFFFGSMYDKDHFTMNIKMGIINYDKGEYSTVVISELLKNNFIDVTIYEEEKELNEDIKNKTIDGFIIIPSDFSYYYNSLDIPPSLSLGTDPSQRFLVSILNGVIRNIVAKRFSNIYSSESNEFNFEPAKILEVEVLHKNVDSNGFIITLSQSAVWICFGLVTSFVGFMGLEFRSGCFIKFFLSPIKKGEFLFYKGASLFLTQIFLVLCLFVITWFFIPFTFNILNLIVSIISLSLFFTSLMLLISTLVDLESENASGLANSFLLVLGMLGGVMIPIVFMPDWMITLSKITPIYHVIFCLEGSTWRNLKFLEILPSITYLMTMAFIMYLFSVRRFDFNYH